MLQNHPEHIHFHRHPILKSHHPVTKGTVNKERHAEKREITWMPTADKGQNVTKFSGVEVGKEDRLMPRQQDIARQSWCLQKAHGQSTGQKSEFTKSSRHMRARQGRLCTQHQTKHTQNHDKYFRPRNERDWNDNDWPSKMKHITALQSKHTTFSLRAQQRANQG